VREGPATVLAALRARQGPSLPLPARAGASSATEVDRFDRERLYELVDGAAEGYLSHGFEACVTQTYSFPGPPAFEIAAEAHRFGSATGARAQLASEAPRQALPVPAMADAVSDGSVLLVIRQRDLLKLTSLTNDPRGRDALLDIARAWKDLP